ncbi:MAG: 16S rRNA (adenine(1518)-N(6)/adenine(1519)-N(6))-dimethyltransferase RsmA [Bacteroidales bacterium]|nr:16S rRNA (adenine(1518)-N(6)/adenine(1519)-N(6))-dimethyltransferase RsmA [Bacteroidales bacterium]
MEKNNPPASSRVKAKKSLGQHFLNDANIARNIAQSLLSKGKVLEIGPGMGMLTQFLLQNQEIDLKVVEIDSESCEYLVKHYPQLNDRLIRADFLNLHPSEIFPEPFAIIGNFPYNISSQILFKVYEHPEWVTEITGMFQREVARRIVSPPGNKDYGILSVLLQTYYHCEYLFTVPETVFSPPPKVKSGVIRLLKKKENYSGFSKETLTGLVKAAFNQRRKTLRNALSGYTFENPSAVEKWMNKRAEQLSFEEFLELCMQVKAR